MSPEVEEEGVAVRDLKDFYCGGARLLSDIAHPALPHHWDCSSLLFSVADEEMPEYCLGDVGMQEYALVPRPVSCVSDVNSERDASSARDDDYDVVALSVVYDAHGAQCEGGGRVLRQRGWSKSLYSIKSKQQRQYRGEAEPGTKEE